MIFDLFGGIGLITRDDPDRSLREAFAVAVFLGWSRSFRFRLFGFLFAPDVVFRRHLADRSARRSLVAAAEQARHGDHPRERQTGLEAARDLARTVRPGKSPGAGPCDYFRVGIETTVSPGRRRAYWVTSPFPHPR